MDWKAAKARTEVIVPWITIGGLLAGGIYSLVEYRTRQRDRRVETTMAYVTRFMSPPLSEHRSALRKQWQKSEIDILAILQDRSLTPAEANRRYTGRIMEMVTDGDLKVPLEEVSLFYEQLANCVRLDLCDANTVTLMLDAQAKEFIHQYYPFICAVRSSWNDPSYGREMERIFNPKSLTKDYCQ